MEGDSGLKAFADLRIGGALIISGCSVCQGRDGLFASMPRKLGRDGRWRNVVSTADEQLKEHYQRIILNAYEEGLSAAEG